MIKKNLEFEYICLILNIKLFLEYWNLLHLSTTLIKIIIHMYIIHY